MDLKKPAKSPQQFGFADYFGPNAVAGSTPAGDTIT